MRALTPAYLRNLPLWLSVGIWLVALLSPTMYCVLLAIASRSQFGALPAGLVIYLVPVVPVVALLICGSLVWLSPLNVRWRVAWLGFTLFTMCLQCGILFVIIVSALTVAISPA